MKKTFEQNGIEFTIEVDFEKSTKERSPDGATTHLIEVKSKDGRYDQTHEISLWTKFNNALATFEGAVSGAELMARDWANSLNGDWEQNILRELGFKGHRLEVENGGN